LALVAALDARDSYSAEHSEALVELTQSVARRLGLDEEQASEVKWMALLHDIGKVGVPDAVLLKPAPTGRERMRLAMGIASPARPSGCPNPSQRS
jgi:HD-GYP domain-containing protein (c-di-GMP phosphodiesterase class II)